MSLRWCAERGITPHWHCDAANIASVRVAEKIGFERAMEYTVIYLS